MAKGGALRDSSINWIFLQRLPIQNHSNPSITEKRWNYFTISRYYFKTEIVILWVFWKKGALKNFEKFTGKPCARACGRVTSYTHARVWGVKKFIFQKIRRALFSCNTCFEICPFPLLSKISTPATLFFVCQIYSHILHEKQCKTISLTVLLTFSMEEQLKKMLLFLLNVTMK